MIKKSLDFDRDIAKFTNRQMEATRLMDTGKVKYLLYGGALGGGKAISIYTPILCDFGWKTMEDVFIGDKVFDEQGNLCNVVGTTEIMYNRPCYKIKLSDNSEFIVDESHEWLTFNAKERDKSQKSTEEYRAKRRKTRPSRGTGKRPDLALLNKKREYQYDQQSCGKIRTTKEIYNTLTITSGNYIENNHAIPIAKALNTTEKELLVDPFLLGAWLGDGSSSGGQICIPPGKEEIRLEIERRGYVTTHGKNPMYCGIPGLKAKLREIGVLNNKHIPSDYLRASNKQRFDLLSGLIDTDGTCDDDGGIEYYSSRKILAENTYELISSLGIKSTLNKKKAICNGKDYGDSYRIKFTTNKKVFILPRKLIKQKKNVRKTQDFRMIVSCEKTESVPVKCIQVDSPSHLYLIGKNLVPTHNSYWLRWVVVRYLMRLFFRKGLRRVNGMLACEDYPALKDRQMSKIANEFPAWLGRSSADHKDYGRCFILNPEYGEGIICFRNLDDPSKYASSEFSIIAVDELTKNPYDVFTHVRTRLRWPGLTDDECLFVAGSNPGGVGHAAYKQLWMDKSFPEEFIHPIDYRSKFAYVPSKADDNPYLPSSYWQMLNTLPTSIRKAFRDGDWNIFLGQAFQEFNPNIHVIKPLPIPKDTQIYMTFDWGFGAPFSVCWFWVDADGRVYLFNEWYGWNGMANQGLRLSDSDIADGILKREVEIGLDVKNLIRIAGSDCFQKKPDYKGGGQGPSTSEIFASKGIYLQVGDSNRSLKIRQFRERLRIKRDERGDIIEPPMMLIYNTCEQFIRTIPALMLNKNNIEDVDTSGEDHVFDSVCHVCMARVIVMKGEEMRPLTQEERVWKVIQGEEPVNILKEQAETGGGFEYAEETNIFEG